MHSAFLFWTLYTALNAKLHCTAHFFCTLYTSLHYTALHCTLHTAKLTGTCCRKGWSRLAAHLEGQLVDAFCTLHTFSAQCILFLQTVHRTKPCTLNAAQCTLNTAQCTLNTAQYTLNTAQCTLQTSHLTIPIQQYTV